MSLATLLIQIILTVPLTIILNYFKNKDNRCLNQILIPTIYIILISALIPSIKQNIFLIVVFEIFIRNFYITNVTNQSKNISNMRFIIESIISIVLSIFTYNYFISKVDSVIPEPESIKAFLWFLIVLFLISLYKISNKNNINKEEIKSNEIKKEQVVIKYAEFKTKYSSLVKSRNSIVNNMAYALMIYNDRMNPKIGRKIKEFIYSFSKNENKYGIMQVPSYVKISDEESIRMTVKELERKVKNSKLKSNEQVDLLLKDINGKEEILKIYNIILEFQR